jgi:methyl-accepting chemotaxis protein
MQNWTIGKRLVVGFSTVLAITFVLGVFSYVQMVTIRRNALAITGDSLPGVTTMGQVAAALKEGKALLLEHVLSSDKAQMAELESKIAENGAKVDAALKQYEKSITVQRDRELYSAIGQSLAEMRRVRSEAVIPPSRAAKQDEAMAAFYSKFVPASDAVINAAEAEFDYNAKSGEELSADITSAVAFANTGVVVVLVAALLLGSAVAYTIFRTTNAVLSASVNELTAGAEQVAAASSQVSTAAQSLSQGSTEQAASLEETSASMEEMASMTRQNAENATRAADLVAETANVVQTANGALEAMVSSMTRITESSDKVSKIIKTIDEIAFQTNILALNAAVEAARAGEAGMGFAVVADEVRNLAQRSAQAAKDTAGLIEESIQNAQQGGATLQQVTSSIGAITQSANKVKGLVDEISVAGRQQAQGIDQVTQAISQMEKVTQTTAATAEESAAASEELNAQAETSMIVVRKLQALVGGPRSESAVVKPSLAYRATRPAPIVAAAPKAKNVVRIGRGTSEVALDREAILPLEDTGTFGRF